MIGTYSSRSYVCLQSRSFAGGADEAEMASEP